MIDRRSKNKKKGFTLFFAVVVIAIVLSIGMSLSMLAFKQASVSNIRRESQHAYYASESGTACALYLLNKKLTTQPSAPSIDGHCNGEELLFNSGVKDSFDYLPPYNYRAEVTLTRTDSSSGARWEIISNGINRSSDIAVRIQRSQGVDVSVGASARTHDVMIAVDHSGSICSRGNYPEGTQNCPAHKIMREAVVEFINRLIPDATANPRNNVGILSFAGTGCTYAGCDLGGGTRFGQPKIQMHLTASKQDNLNVIGDISNSAINANGTYLKISYGDGTNIYDALRIAECEFSNKELSTPFHYMSSCTDTSPTDKYDSSDISHPDILFLFTDGRPTFYDGGHPGTRSQPDDDGECDLLWQQHVDVATRLKEDQNVKIFVIGIGEQMKSNAKACSNPAHSNPIYGGKNTQTIFRTLIASDDQFIYVDEYNKKSILDAFERLTQFAGISINITE